MRADDKPDSAPDRDGDDPCQGAKLSPRPPKGKDDGVRPKAEEDTAAEVRRLALRVRWHVGIGAAA